MGGGFEIVAAQIYIHFVVNPPVRRGYMTRQQAKLLLADKSELLLVMQQFTGRHPAQQQQIKPRFGGVFFRLEKCDGNIT